MRFLSRYAIPAGLLCLCALAGPVAVVASAAAPQVGEAVLVVARHPDRLVARADGRLIAPVSAPFAALASFDAGGLERLARLKPWLVIDGRLMLAACGALVE